MIATDEVCFLGIDVGGTTIKIGLAGRNGQTCFLGSLPTENSKGPQFSVGEINRFVHSQMDESVWHRVRGVGLGTPGPLDSATGIILEPYNLPGWKNFPIVNCLSEELGRPVAYTNDANAAALGEFWLGKGMGSRSLILITLGTGVGAGTIIDGAIVTGANDLAAECGHMTIDFSDDAPICSCGKKGHLEAYASATAVARLAAESALENHQGMLARHQNEQGLLDARSVYQCALAGDSDSLQIIDRVALYLSRGIADIAHIFDPEVILLGGAMNFGGWECSVGLQFIQHIRDRVKKLVFPRIADNLKIDFASLGGAAGWIGAAGLANRVYDQDHE